jgi:CotH protein/lamin tail-like protein
MRWGVPLAAIALLTTPALMAQVVINEIMYHPASDDNGEEFVELVNASATAVDLSGWTLDNAVRYTFPASTILASGEFLVIANSPVDFEAKYGTGIALGPWEGKLSNGGERIEVRDDGGALADEVLYSDTGAWPSEADGDGPSLELINPGLDNSLGLAWTASAPASAEGTPGQPNSVFNADPPPIIHGVEITPVIPSSEQTVTVVASVLDEGDLATMTLWWRLDVAAGFASVEMVDDGAHGDGAAGDRQHGAQIPPQPDQSVIECYVEATDTADQARLFPASAPEENLLCQVENSPPDDFGGLPLYRVVMSQRDWITLRTRPLESNDLLNATFIADGQAWHNAGIRYRGRSSRNLAEKSYRIDFEAETFGEIGELNLNSNNPEQVRMAMDLFDRAGMPAPFTQLAAFTIRSEIQELKCQVESYDDTFLPRHYGETNDQGNLYRGERNADLTYLGENFDSYRSWYLKETNSEEDDFSDVVALCDAFTNLSDAEFGAQIGDFIDVDQWLRFIAINTLLANLEGSIYNYRGDDYFMYHSPATDLFEILPWDMDETFITPDHSIFRPALASIRRLITHPEFAGRYHGFVQEIADTVFTPEIMSTRISEELTGHFSDERTAEILDYVLLRQEDLAPQTPTCLATSFAIDEIPAIALGDTWRYFPGTEEPAGAGNPISQWASPEFDDSSWEEGPSGFASFEIAIFPTGTFFNDNRFRYSTLYLRRLFTIDDPDEVRDLFFDVGYADGWVLYLNGVEVARANVHPSHPEGEPVPHTGVSASPHRPDFLEHVDLTDHLDLLIPGENLLALQLFNDHIGYSTMGVFPQLTVALGPKAHAVIDSGDLWYSFAGTEEPSMGDPALPALPWHHPHFRFRSEWGGQFTEQLAPFGYGHSDLGTDLSSMQGVNTTHHIRRSFDVTDCSAVTGVRMRIRYDDGFVAYLNGVEVARRNAPGLPGSAVDHTAVAAASHTAGSAREVIDLSAHISDLFSGPNSFAIVGLNADIDDDAFLLDPSLEMDMLPAGQFLASPEPTLDLRGIAPVMDTREVRINGTPADLTVHTGQWRSMLSLSPGLNTFTITAHDAEGNLVDLSTLNLISAPDPTVVSGTLALDTVWRPQDGPIRITGDLTVADGAELRIEPGTIVGLDPAVRLLVAGSLWAGGDASQPVIFTSATPFTRWDLVHLQGTDAPTVLDGCLFDWGSIMQLGGQLRMTDSAMRYSTGSSLGGHSLSTHQCDTLIERCLWSDNESQLIHTLPVSTVFRDSAVVRIWGDRDGIDFFTDQGAPLPELVLVENSYFDTVGDDGIDFDGFDAIARGNYIRGAVDKGISASFGHTLGEENVVVDCTVGIRIKATGEATLNHNTVVGGRHAVLAADTAALSLSNSIIWGQSDQPIVTDALGTITVTHSDVTGGAPSGEGNISEDPLFLDPDHGNFELTAGSPCRGTAASGEDMGALPFEGEPQGGLSVF